MIKSTLALAAITLIAAPAFAETNVWKTGQGYTVRDGDLDRKTPQGRAAMLARVEAASAKVCADRGPRVRYEACVTKSRDQAIARTSPTLQRALTLALAERASATQLAGR